MLTFAICDDEPSQIEYVKNIVTSWTEANHQPAKIYTFPSAEAFYCTDYLYNRMKLGIPRLLNGTPNFFYS